MPSVFGIPKIPFWLGIAGLIPFGIGAVLSFTPGAGGPQILIAYGITILSFMSGALWGFATKSGGRDRLWAYGLSVLPALWVFLMVQDSKIALGLYGLDPIPALIYGFIGILALDMLYGFRGLAPSWWLRLRLTLTSVAVLCLFLGKIA